MELSRISGIISIMIFRDEPDLMERSDINFFWRVKINLTGPQSATLRIYNCKSRRATNQICCFIPLEQTLLRFHSEIIVILLN